MKKCFICTTSASIADKINSVIFAKRIAEEAEAKKKKTIIVTAICAAVATVAVVGAVVALVIVKKKEIDLGIKSFIAKVKSKLPCKKVECEEICEDACEYTCEDAEAEETVEE